MLVCAFVCFLSKSNFKLASVDDRDFVQLSNSLIDRFWGIWNLCCTAKPGIMFFMTLEHLLFLMGMKFHKVRHVARRINSPFEHFWGHPEPVPCGQTRQIKFCDENEPDHSDWYRNWWSLICRTALFQCLRNMSTSGHPETIPRNMCGHLSSKTNFILVSHLFHFSSCKINTWLWKTRNLLENV